jgi:uncharacterized protein YdhG (YjbR/CyaY superfamily)
MSRKDSSRASRFPAIEKKYGEPMTHWFKVMAKMKGETYPAQMAHLQENYGFSRDHANALVMYSRGSTSSQRFTTPSEYFSEIKPMQARTIKAVFAVIKAKHPALELVIAWNQPMLRQKKSYILGASVTKGYILLNPFSKEVINTFAPEMKELRVLKHTFAIPNDWEVDKKLIEGIARARLAELK